MRQSRCQLPGEVRPSTVLLRSKPHSEQRSAPSVPEQYARLLWCVSAHSTKNRLPVLPGMELSYSPIGVVDGCCPSWNSTAIV